MRQRAAVRAIAAQIPTALRQMRARMMLESVHEFLGVDEVPCPACDGSGWLSRRRLERCPVCCGFRQVPVGLGDWYRSQERHNHEEHEGHEGRREGKNGGTTGTTDGDGLIYMIGEDRTPADLGAEPEAFVVFEPSQ